MRPGRGRIPLWMGARRGRVRTSLFVVDVGYLVVHHGVHRQLLTEHGADDGDGGRIFQWEYGHLMDDLYHWKHMVGCQGSYNEYWLYVETLKGYRGGSRTGGPGAGVVEISASCNFSWGWGHRAHFLRFWGYRPPAPPWCSPMSEGVCETEYNRKDRQIGEA